MTGFVYRWLARRNALRRVQLAALSATWCAAPSAFAFRTSGELYGLTLEQSPRWTSPLLTFDVWSEVPANLSPTAAHEAIVKGFAAWTALDCLALKVDARALTTQPPVHGDGRNTVGWLREWSWESSGAKSIGTTDLTFGVGADGRWQILEADILLNPNIAWTTNRAIADAADVTAVVAHEVGHFLGLDHPCELDGSGGAPLCTPLADASLLHPTYRGVVQTPSDDDRTGACALYPFDPSTCTVPLTASSPSKCALYCQSNACPIVADNGAESTGAVACASGVDCAGAKTEPCSTLADCPTGTTCSASLCMALAAKAGDPCRRNDECQSRVCTGGFCAEACDPAAQTCVAAASGFGALCVEAVECVSRLCLEVRPGQNMCTRTCDQKYNDCPSSTECRGIEGQDVCIPSEAALDGGCGCTVAPRRHSWLVPAAIALSAMLTRRMGRRERTSRAGKNS